ncbi:MAG: hypothetical protein ACXWO1_16445, partial [Isosphaeraceae bacterium]
RESCSTYAAVLADRAAFCHLRMDRFTRLLCPASPDNLGLGSGVDRKAKWSFEDARAVSKG